MKRAAYDFESCGKMASSGQESLSHVLYPGRSDTPPSPVMDRTVNGSGRGYAHRVHSRSSSWSFTGSQGIGPADLSSSLAAINPIRSVIREFVPSLTRTDEHDNQPLLRTSRASSQLSLSLSSRTGNEEDLVHPPSRNFSNTALASAVHGFPREESLTSVGSNAGRNQPFVAAENLPGGPTLMNVGGPPEEANGTGAAGAGGSGEISDWVRWVEQNTIFFILLLIRYAWMHKSGLLVLIGMFVTYLHCNQTIKNQVALKNKRDKKVLLLVILFLCGNIYFVYFVFREDKLHKCLIFMTPMLFLDLWNLSWCICVTDFIVRFGTMVLKALVSLCFHFILPSRKKGKYYMLLEYSSQFYRTLLPTPLWFGFFSNYYETDTVFAVIITAVYLMIKGAVLLARARELFRAFVSFIQDQTYGTNPTREELMESNNNMCPICQEEFSDPIMLRCKHIFCENCVLQWFDRERTCPLCRASIASDPKWRDGSTSIWPQPF